MNKKAFAVSIPQETLDDLRARLTKARWAADFCNAGWEYGTNEAYLRELVDCWIHEYDWREHENAINEFANYQTEIEEIPIHFIHEPGKGPKPLPLIMSHGWPWTFWDFQKVIRPLADPSSYGGDPEDAFDVVVPSLPGYGFSTPLRKPGINYWRTADLWVKLMQDVLGYERFAAQGADWGSAVTAQLGHKYADRVIGIHLHFMLPLRLSIIPIKDKQLYDPDELEHYYNKNQRYFTDENGYSAIQLTRPQTLSYGLNDSPIGLCAWILEKRRGWSDCDGDVERRFSKDDLLTTMTLYWVTQSIGTSVRYYYEATHNPWKPSHERTPVVEAPTGIAIFPKDIWVLPKRWAEGHYNLKRWTVMPSGGHFAPMEEPERLVEDIRAFFRPLRR